MDAPRPPASSPTSPSPLPASAGESPFSIIRFRLWGNILLIRYTLHFTAGLRALPRRAAAPAAPDEEGRRRRPLHLRRGLRRIAVAGAATTGVALRAGRRAAMAAPALLDRAALPPPPEPRLGRGSSISSPSFPPSGPGPGPSRRLPSRPGAGPSRRPPPGLGACAGAVGDASNGSAMVWYLEVREGAGGKATVLPPNLP